LEKTTGGQYYLQVRARNKRRRGKKKGRILCNAICLRIISKKKKKRKGKIFSKQQCMIGRLRGSTPGEKGKVWKWGGQKIASLEGTSSGEN